MYARRLQPLLRELLAEFRIVYLTGPRQAGKTTLARSVSRDLGLEYVTLDDQATLASVQSDPHGFLRSLGDKRAVLDEFQYVPALIPAIKEISDRLDPHEKGKFLLTGSADIFRSARTQESLPGHMARLELLPLSVTELHGQPLNVIDHLSAGEFTHVPAASATREDYVWKQEEQWEPLWDDVEKLAQSNVDGDRTEAHFMGAIVLQQMQPPAGTMERRVVVDGQQRLTTLQLLIDAIREVLEDRGHSDPAKRLAALVENGEEYRGGQPDHAFKVWPTIVDRVAFRHAMSNKSSVTDHATSRIVQAHEYFKNQARGWLDGFPDENGKRKAARAKRKAADALETAVRANLEIVVIDLGDSDDPHVNSRR